MEKKGLSQEGLKLIACITMLLDHIGAVFCSGMELRIVGRLSFPIFCFLLAEGAVRTRNPKKYALRLAIGAVLSELPYDFLFYGGFTWAHQSVMVTLLLGYGMLVCLKRAQSPGRKLLCVIPFVLAAELMHVDYGGAGVVIIALFAVTRDLPKGLWIQILGQLAIWWLKGGYQLPLGPVRVPIQLFAVLSMIPIALYTGRKASQNRLLQWGFYLFYPVHLTVFLLLS